MGDLFNIEEIDVYDKKEDLFDFLVEGVELVLFGKYCKLKVISVWLYFEVRKIVENDDSKLFLFWYNFVECFEGEFKMGYIFIYKEIKEKLNGFFEEYERLLLFISVVVVWSNDLKDDLLW